MDYQYTNAYKIQTYMFLQLETIIVLDYQKEKKIQGVYELSKALNLEHLATLHLYKQGNPWA